MPGGGNVISKIAVIDCSGGTIGQVSYINLTTSAPCGPWGFTRDAAGNFYIPDGGSCQIYKYDSTGQFITIIDVNFTALSDPDGSYYLEDVFAGADNKLYCSNCGNPAIVLKMDLDGTNQEVIFDPGMEEGGPR